MQHPSYFTRRNANGEVTAVSSEQLEGGEAMDTNSPEVVAFLEKAQGQAAHFSTSDAEFVRVLEDLIDALISKNILRHTDLPLAAQRKITARKGMRNRLQGALNIFRHDDPVL